MRVRSFSREQWLCGFCLSHFSSALCRSVFVYIFFFLFNCFLFFYFGTPSEVDGSPLTVLKNVTIATNAFIYVSLTKLVKLILFFELWSVRSIHIHVAVILHIHSFLQPQSLYLPTWMCSSRLHFFFTFRSNFHHQHPKFCWFQFYHLFKVLFTSSVYLLFYFRFFFHIFRAVVAIAIAVIRRPFFFFNIQLATACVAVI